MGAIALQTLIQQARPSTSMEVDNEGTWVTLNRGESWVRFTWNASDW